jgi:hypothetical protein
MDSVQDGKTGILIKSGNSAVLPGAVFCPSEDERSPRLPGCPASLNVGLIFQSLRSCEDMFRCSGQYNNIYTIRFGMRDMVCSTYYNNMSTVSS